MLICTLLTVQTVRRVFLKAGKKNFYLHTIFTIMLFNRHKTWLLYKCQKEQGKKRKTALKA